MYSRRQIIKQLSRLGLLLPITGWFPALGFADEDDRSAQRKVDIFLDLSRFLTGFDDLDAELGRSFLQHLEQGDANVALLDLLALFEANRSASDDELRALLLRHRGLRDVAKTIARLWYSGWLTETDQIPAEMLAKGYTRSLAWQSMKLTARGCLRVGSGKTPHTGSVEVRSRHGDLRHGDRWRRHCGQPARRRIGAEWPAGSDP